MTIKLYQNASPPDYVNKEIVLIDEIEGTLRAPTSILNPTITFERASLSGFNYAHIPEFNRYYYLGGVSSEVNGLISVSFIVDVLMSAKDAIYNMYAIIKRQENQYNLYLDDGIFKGYQNTKHKIIRLPYGFTDYSYVLALAGNGS